MNFNKKIAAVMMTVSGTVLMGAYLLSPPPLTDEKSKNIEIYKSNDATASKKASEVKATEEQSVEEIESQALTGTFLSENEVVFAPVITELYSRGVDSSFIKEVVNHPKTSFNDKFVKINVTGYLKKPDYSSHYNKRSINKSKKFLTENYDLLHEAEKEYGVPAEAITSILWVETRHGGYTGNNQLPSVFLSTALANEDEYIDLNLEVLEKEHKKNSNEYKKLKKKILSRAKRKSGWALDQLVAMSKINNRLPVPVTEIEGSWAGAFGWSQFLPSSYKEWAVDGDGDGKVDLFKKEDAIFSVANYLKKHGWGNSVKAQRKAVYGYNHSNDYVDAVLKLADKIKS
jgi:membrane-bound lytic murein transglycosylase B